MTRTDPNAGRQRLALTAILNMAPPAARAALALELAADALQHALADGLLADPAAVRACDDAIFRIGNLTVAANRALGYAPAPIGAPRAATVVRLRPVEGGAA